MFFSIQSTILQIPQIIANLAICMALVRTSSFFTTQLNSLLFSSWKEPKLSFRTIYFISTLLYSLLYSILLTSFALNILAVDIHSKDLEMPTMRGKNQDEQASGDTPLLVNTNPERIDKGIDVITMMNKLSRITSGLIKEGRVNGGCCYLFSHLLLQLLLSLEGSL